MVIDVEMEQLQEINSHIEGYTPPPLPGLKRPKKIKIP